MIDTLSRLIPYTRDVYYSTLDQYSNVIWPAQIVAYVLSLLALWAALRHFAGSGRVVATVLAAAWIWTGIVFHIFTFSQINWAAWPIGALFLLQALLFLVAGTMLNRLSFRFTAASPAHICGLVFAAGALLIYPLLESTLGLALPGTGLVGVSPGPTTLFTLGILLLGAPRPRLYLFVIPVLWAAIAGIAGLVLTVPQDMWLPVAAFLAVILAVGRRFSPSSAA